MDPEKVPPTSTMDACHFSSFNTSAPPSPSTEETTSRLPKGIYVPILAFFTPTDEIDIPATQRHVARLLASGITGLVLHGSNGEAAHLTRAERRLITSTVVDAVRHASDPPNPAFPIIAGCSAQSVRETVELCHEAHQAGATHALILPPGYYASLMGTGDIVAYFHRVADRSPVPVLIYNFPAAAHGVDLNSDTILRIASHQRIAGVKLTCGNTGKLARLVADVSKVRDGRDDFFVAGGSADFLLQGLVVGAHGSIAGFANLAPRSCVRIMELWAEGRTKEARELQGEVARADWLAIRYGFVGVKAAMPMSWGEGERSACEPRGPLRRLEQGSKEEREIYEGLNGILSIEKGLESSEVIV